MPILRNGRTTNPPAAATVSTTGHTPLGVGKPNRGWLHPDDLFAQDGINYAVRYIGCVEVLTSMKVLDFDTRSAIAKECIHRVCEAAGVKAVDSKRRVDRKIAAQLGEKARINELTANTSVKLTITSELLRLSDLDTGQEILSHTMPNVSFASGGDADTADYIAYVGKDPEEVRTCVVMECCGGLAQNVITTIGQAFELRLKECLRRDPANSSTATQESNMQASAGPMPAVRGQRRPDDVEYYNDMPGKRPPPTTQPLSSSSPQWSKKDSLSNNLIDFSDSASCSASRQTHAPAAASVTSSAGPEYVNGVVAATTAQKPSGFSRANRPDPVGMPPASTTSGKDPFDMSPFSTRPPTGLVGVPVTSPAKSLHEQMRRQLQQEEWFHGGGVSRVEAESRLQRDGDFLVRESQGSPGQYVLTGMQGGAKKHLLLVDPEGVVRTKDRAFDSVGHLIRYHRDNSLPIISAESALRLKTPVPRPLEATGFRM